MEVVVESITGRRRTFSNVNPQETVRGLKTRIWKIDGIPIARQSFVYRNQALQDDKTLAFYQVVDGAVIKLVLMTRAGPINKIVELSPNKVDVSVPSTSSSTGAAGGGGDLDGAGVADGSNVRRYTRQQMRQVQLTAAAEACAKNNNSQNAVTTAGASNLADVARQLSKSSLVDSSVQQPQQHQERSIAATSSNNSRADENYRTMQRMREIRRSIERLNLEKNQQANNGGQRQWQQRNNSGGGNGSNGEFASSRNRRPTGSGSLQANASAATSGGTGGSGGGSSRMRSSASTQITVTSGDRYTAAAAAARAAYAADDTSAKESSAGETEIEDAACCYRQLSTSNTVASSKPPAAASSGCSSIPPRSRAHSSSQHQLMPPQGFKSKYQLFRHIRRSSCSDVDVESSAIWSSDPETDAVFLNDRGANEELFTADDWSLDDEDWDAMGEQEDEARRAISAVDDSSDYEDAVGSGVGGGSGDNERRLPPSTTADKHSSSADDDNDGSAAPAAAAQDGVVGSSSQRARNFGGQDISSDPSELSSGVVICELAMAMNNRRMKVKRKSYHTPRHGGYKRPQAAFAATTTSSAIMNMQAPVTRGGAGAGAVDETDDQQSPLESPVKTAPASIPSSRFLHHHNNVACLYRDQQQHHHLHAGYIPVGTGGGYYAGSVGPGSRAWHRGRPRSKQRSSITATNNSNNSANANNYVNSSGLSGPSAAATEPQNGQQLLVTHNSTTTGESSSDEPEDSSGRRESQMTTSTASAVLTASIAAAANANISGGGRASTIGHGHKPPQSSQSQQRCNACACRLSVATTFQCRCGKTVCLRHRHADLHACSLLASAAVSEKKF